MSKLTPRDKGYTDQDETLVLVKCPFKDHPNCPAAKGRIRCTWRCELGEWVPQWWYDQNIAPYL
jgi:hypothetical protein